MLGRRTVRTEERAAAPAARKRRTGVRAAGPQASLRAQAHDVSRRWRRQAGEDAGRRRRVHARPVHHDGDEAAATGDDQTDVAGDRQPD